MSDKDRKAVLERVAKLESLVTAVQAGEERRCEVCNQTLTYHGPGSGRHPGIYCETGCTSILIEVGPRRE